MMRRRMRGVLTGTVGAVLAVALAQAAPSGQPVYGTARAGGPVEVSLDGFAWQPFTGGALLDGASVRTGIGGSATVDLPSGDVLAVGDGSTAHLGPATPAGVRLEAGRLVVKLRPGSTLAVDTDVATIREPLGATVDGPVREGTILVSDGTLSVRCTGGELEVVNKTGGVVTLDAGDTLTIAPGQLQPLLTQSGLPNDPWHATRVVGNPASDPLLKPSPLWAGAVVAATVIVSGAAACLGML